MQQNYNLIQMILSSKSLERLDRIRIHNKEKAESIEKMVLSRFNQIRAKIGDDEFILMLKDEDKKDVKPDIFVYRRGGDLDLDDSD